MSIVLRHGAEAASGPLYVRVAEAIRERVFELRLQPGDLVEPERVLVGELGVSRVTLRKAIDLLVSEHLLVRRQGVGTYVAATRVSYPLLGLHSTRDIARAHGLPVEVRIVEHGTRAASSEERARLELGRGERVLSFVRRDLVESKPVSVAECVLPERFAPALAREAVARHSTYELIEQEHGLQLTRARQTLRAEEASAKIARLLGLRRGRPIFVLDRVTYSARGEPVEWGLISYRHDGVECVVELRRQSGGRRESATDAVLRYPGVARRNG